MYLPINEGVSLRKREHLSVLRQYVRSEGEGQSRLQQIANTWCHLAYNNHSGNHVFIFPGQNPTCSWLSMAASTQPLDKLGP